MSPVLRPIAYLGRILLPAVAVLAWASGVAVAQWTGSGFDSGAWTVRAAANEQSLWLAQVNEVRSRIMRRESGSDFALVTTLEGPVSLLSAGSFSALTFFQDNRVYRVTPDDSRPESYLPGSRPPLDATQAGNQVFALIATGSAVELALRNAAAETQPAFEPGDAPLSLVVYDGRRWSTLAACPPTIDAQSDRRLNPRICWTQDALLLVWKAAQGEGLQHARFDVATRTWSRAGTIGIANARGFWIALVNRAPTLVVAVEAEPQREEVVAFRLLGDGEGESGWRRADLHISAGPPQGSFTRYEDAFGFNQHLGLLALDPEKRYYVAFARTDAPPSEKTINVAEVFGRPERELRTEGSVQMFTLVLLAAVLIALFVFRRQSMVQAATLPPTVELAYSFQRVIGWFIDVVPFGVIAAWVLGIDLMQAIEQLSSWAFAAEPALPDRLVLGWWALAVAGYSLYCLVMELLTGKTVGKLLTGVRVLSETGLPPATWQVITRNVLRPLELMPQFWIVAFLVVLSRNRQRLGDIFARTVAVRLRPPQPEQRQADRDEDDGGPV